MIWPDRGLALAALVPGLISLLLLLPRPGVFWMALMALDSVLLALALIDLASLIGPARLRATRECGGTASIGEPHPVELTIVNEGRRPRGFRVRDDVPDPFEAGPPEFLVRIPPGGRATLDYRMTPHRRGSFALRRVYLLERSRWGLWQRSRWHPVESGVRVYPDVRQIARYTLLARRDRLGAIGLRRSRRVGTDNEFERLRDYSEGDEPRRIDWRATARRRRVTVRDYQNSQSQRVIFLIDSGRMMAGDTGDGLSPLDHAFNAMLMLAHVALVRGDQVGLMVYADRVRAYVPPTGGPRRIERLVHAIHDVFPMLVEPRHDRAVVELERRCRKRSLLVMMTNVFDEVGARQVLDHLGNVVGRHLPLGVFLRDADLFALADSGLDPAALPGSTPEERLFAPAAAAAMLNWRERVIASLRRRGVLALDVTPEELTAPLINAYLDVKARHLL
ncbi:DUF58 domain-containing protein [Tautonia plasticadhaerens]|uniref:DUF58 domain-containing protein n=1 Tax=Tautonia plasticadhaerens TaxID=2527974 RepID=A0A518H7M8_9BACT|nr:DUF58 domain-containing protein [Tautonia plasticadhaerens]QDV36791.1 hypothetical protein ElP_47200 [Tautonia plasticadhaerens]